VALDLAIGQRRLGHEVMAIGLAPGPLRRDFVAAGVDVRTMFKRGGFDAQLLARLAFVLRTAKVDVVHTHNPQALIYGAPAGRLASARVVHTKHGANPDNARRLWLRRAAGALTHAYVSVSALTAEVAAANREAPASRRHTIPNGIDLDRFYPDAADRAAIRAELGIPADAFVFGTVGRVAVEKNQALLLRAAAPLLDAKTHLIVVGDGAEMPMLAQLARDLPSVHLVGARRDVPNLLRAFDVFALSSVTEGLPLVLPEAMATGLPLISTAVGGIPAVIDADLGLLVPPSDEAALRHALTTLHQDREKAVRFGARAREQALSKYSATRMVADYLRVYRSGL